MKFFAGVDVSRDGADLCVIDSRGVIRVEKEISSVHNIAKDINDLDYEIEIVGIESGSMSFYIMDALESFGLSSVCMEARHAKAIMSQSLNKTDKGDARQLAQLAMSGWFKSVYKKQFEARVSRSMLGLRKVYLEKFLSLKAALEDTRRELDLGPTRVGDIDKDTIGQADEVVKSGLSDMLMLIEEGVERMRTDLRRLSKIIEEKAKSDPVCRLLMTVPGVGYLTALSFRATVDNPHRFKRSRQVSAYIGLTPRRRQSGRLNQQSAISKRGDKATRGYLYHAAFVTICSGKDCDLQRWGQRLRASIGLVRARIAVARKLACIMHRMWVTETAFIPFIPDRRLPLQSGK